MSKLQLSEPFPNVQEIWTCPITGLKVPKIPLVNIRWREDLLRRAENDPILQADLMAASGESILFWINAFVWTYHQFDIDPDTHKPVPAKHAHNPFVTWAIQDGHIVFLEEGIDIGEDRATRKTRDMGASWDCIAVFHHKWLFRPDSQLLEMSRTEPYVDERGNYKSLFIKHDYINTWLPSWMRPPNCLPGQKNRRKMHIGNELNDSNIDGEPTTAHAGSGDRRLAVLLDEFSKVENGRAMRSATADVTPCRIINSTPNPERGAGTEFSRWLNSGQIKVFVMPWWEHPDKGQGRHVIQDEVTGEYKIRSPWYDNEELRRSPREMACEIDMKDLEAGDAVFTHTNIDKHIALFGREPIVRMDVNFKKGVANDAILGIIRQRKTDTIKMKMGPKGKLSVWTNLLMNRPDQSKRYIIGFDVSKGQGASNSVASVKCKETGQKIAEWVDANTPPYEFARVAIALALWCGGANPRKLPFLKWEMNGPGWDFGRMIVEIFRYPYYYKNKPIGTVTKKPGKKYGWHANRDAKTALLNAYDRLLAHGGYINPSIKALEECKYYIHYPDGGCGPADLLEENAGARKTHGDRTIADALTLDDKEIPKGRGAEVKIPGNSFGYRFKQYKEKRKLMKTGYKHFRHPYGDLSRCLK